MEPDPFESDLMLWNEGEHVREEERERYRPLVEAVRAAEGEVDAVAGDDFLADIFRALHDLEGSERR